MRRRTFVAGLTTFVVAACQSSPPPTPPPPAASPSLAAPPTAASAGAGVAPSPSRPAAPPSPVASPSPVALPAPSPSPAVEPPLALDAHPFAVMVDNIAEARPQSGLGAADVVYEAPAEAGIPRLMPIFLRAGAEADWIGPVRSARHYFVYLANEYRTPLVHIGASPQGFAAFAETSLPDLDEARNDSGFTRDQHRPAPHNAFVRTGSIRASLEARAVQTRPGTAGLTFGAYAAGPEPAASVTIAYPGPERYTVGYDYQADAGTYARSMDGQPHTDGVTGERYAARSIVVEYVGVEPIPSDPALRVEVSLVGAGKGLLVADGTAVPLEWSKPSHRAATLFRRSDGQPFMLPAGQVWIQIVPLETEVEIAVRG